MGSIGTAFTRAGCRIGKWPGARAVCRPRCETSDSNLDCRVIGQIVENDRNCKVPYTLVRLVDKHLSLDLTVFEIGHLISECQKKKHPHIAGHPKRAEQWPITNRNSPALSGFATAQARMGFATLS